MRISRIARAAITAAAALAAVVGLLTANVPGAGQDVTGVDVTGVSDSTDPTHVHNCLITTSKLIYVPAKEAGVLVEIKVRANQQVKEGDLLARIDDQQAVAAMAVADAKVEAAQKEADNDISVRYAQAKWEVAKKKYEKGEESNARVPGSYPYIDLLTMRLDVVASGLEIEHAQYQLQIAAKNTDVRRAELAAAKIDVQRRKVIAPFDGEVVEREREVGEWVKPGDPVIRLVKMDHLQIKAALDASQLTAADVDQRSVSVKVVLPHGEATFKGIINDVSPVVESGNKFYVTVDVTNERDPRDGHWRLSPGRMAEMTIHLKK